MLGARSVTRSKFHTEDLQTLGATVKRLFSFLFRAIVYDCKHGPTTCTVLC